VAAGAAYVWTESPKGVLAAGKGSAILEGTDATFGATVAGVGRVDSSATNDAIAVGATDTVFLFLDTPVGVVPAKDAVAISGAKDEGAGTAIAGTGDVTGDGTSDLSIGAPRSDLSGTDAGVVYLLPGI